MQRQFGEAEGGGCALEGDGKRSPHHWAFDLYAQFFQRQVLRLGVVFVDLGFKPVQRVLLDVRDIVLIGLACVAAVQRGQIFQVP